VDKNAKRKGTEAVAKAYLEYLYSTTGQEIAAKHYFRPQNKEVLAKYATQFPDVKLFTLAEIVGDWQKAQNTHFNDGGIFDQISRGNR
jgi:sulfate transport system substrate-binding protein